MCGILAAFSLSKTELDYDLCNQSIKKVRHRGPDNLGIYKDKSCFLGHTRLSIIGLEQTSNQPLEFGDLIITYNGEIFNYVELKAELEENGYQFSTNSDTEVVIKAYDFWGEKCFEKFNGMWAICIYNRVKKEAIVSRDRFGQKPLFYLKNKDAIYFASEIQQLSSINGPEVNFEVIQNFLKEGTFESQGRTFFKEIFEFPKAHYCILDLDNKIKMKRFWDYYHGEEKKVNANDFQYFTDLLENAIKIRLRSDVPVSLLLSGGVDSTVVSAYSRKFYGDKELDAYCYSSNDNMDESSFAKIVASRLKINLTKREQEQVPQEYKSRLMRLVKHLGRGHSSPAIISVDYLYESIRGSNIKVALDGQGADELLGGYKNYFMVVIPMYLKKLKFKDAYYTFLDQLRFGLVRSIILWLRIILPNNLKTVGRWFYGYERFFSKQNGSNSSRYIKPIKSNGYLNKNPFNRHLIWQHNIGLENLLYYGDIVAMNNSVENRSPFMDHRLIDFALKCDEKLKLFNGIDKYGLRKLKIVEKFKDVLDRKKIGFASDIKSQTIAMMISELEESEILSWPIFSKKLRIFVKNKGFIKYKYQRLLFRLYQVHLWNLIFIKSRDQKL